ncbi:MAG: HAMP domain-containing protein, partial [Myxococcales bacterium]|nr:HAMP domain-containing protein [Myxococcales bacterium]
MPKLVESLRNPAEDDLAYQLRGLKPIEVSSQDEIGQLASAFNDVQKVAGEVAAEQAALLRKGIGEMFVNLARRNQALLDRQIDFIDELERAEEDPDQLENLYRLDHLATRMRRNAESLLVLSGAGQSRQWTEAIPILDVVRAASGEIADFARVSFVGFDGDVAVAGNAVADVTHILAELLENATTFSPP